MAGADDYPAETSMLEELPLLGDNANAETESRKVGRTGGAACTARFYTTKRNQISWRELRSTSIA